jgi:hypothetical protein
MNSSEVFGNFAENHLQWLPELGIGYYPVTAMPYDAEYFARYQAMKYTEIGLKLNVARINLVNKYTQADVLDIGIGNGAFVESRENTCGHDINPHAVEWLVNNKRYRHPFRGASSLTFWDSLEHIHNPTLIMQGAREYVFVSCPIYKSLDHLLTSKHYRKDEHCHYWTHQGLLTFMDYFGFECVEHNSMESDLGREDIGTYVFKRIV